jgi:hypothetical protein
MKIFLEFLDCNGVNHILLNTILLFPFIIFKYMSGYKINLRPQFLLDIVYFLPYLNIYDTYFSTLIH